MLQLLNDICTVASALSTVASSVAEVIGSVTPSPPNQKQQIMIPSSPNTNSAQPAKMLTYSQNTSQYCGPRGYQWENNTYETCMPTTTTTTDATTLSDEIVCKTTNNFVESINMFANSFMFTMFLEDRSEILFSPQSLFLFIASLYVGASEKQKKKFSEINDPVFSKIITNYFLNIIHKIPVNEQNNNIINSAMKLLETSHITNNFYVDISHNVKLNYIEIVQMLGTNVKRVELNTNKKIVEEINNHIASLNLQGSINSCPYFDAFVYSTSNICLYWIKPLKNVNDEKKDIFIRQDGKYTLEKYLICEEDRGLFYENKLISLYEKSCYGTSINVGFMIPKESHIRNFKLSNATNVFDKLKPTKAYFQIPEFTLEAQYKLKNLKYSEIDIINSPQYYEDINGNEPINIQDIIHFNKISFTKEGVFTKKPTPEEVIRVPILYDTSYCSDRVSFKLIKTFVWYVRDIKNGNIILCGIFNGTI